MIRLLTENERKKLALKRVPSKPALDIRQPLGPTLLSEDGPTSGCSALSEESWHVAGLLKGADLRIHPTYSSVISVTAGIR